MGKTCSQLICKGGCGKIRNNFEDLYSLSLEVQGKKTLKDSLEKYISEERIEDFFCSNCQKKVNVIKRTSFAELPNILIIHLQRIIFNYETFMNEKINSRLEFPRKLNLKAYATEVINNIEQEESSNNISSSLTSNNNENIKSQNEAEENSENNNNSQQKEQDAESSKEFKERVFHKSDDYYEYELVGVVVHLGVANAGHYYSYINIQREGTCNKMNFNPNDDSHVRKWMTFNDSSVMNFNLDQMETECFGGSANGKDDAEDLIGWSKKNDWDNSKNAYMLVYERVNKTPITMVIPESQLKQEEALEMKMNYDSINNNDNKENNEDKKNVKLEKEEKSNNDKIIDISKNLTLDSQNSIDCQKKNFIKILEQKRLNEQVITINKSNCYKILKEIHKITSGNAKVSLDCNDTAISRRDITSENIYNFIFYNEDKNEYSYYIPFYMYGKSEKRLLPAAHMREVLLDNLLFSNDQNIFCNEFSEFLDKAVSNLYEFYSKDKNKTENENLYKQTFEVLLGYALNILSKSSSRDALGKLVNNLNKFLESFPEFSKLCLENLANNKELVTDILFSSEENSNLAYKNLVVNAMINYAKFYKNNIISYRELKADYGKNNNNIINNEISEFLNSSKPLVFILLDYLIDLMPCEVAKIWNRMLAYLELFESLATAGNELILDYLFENQLVSRLIDLALGKESPLYRKGESRCEMGNKIAPPKFTPLLNTVSNLVRRSFTETFTKESYTGKKHFPNTFIPLNDNPDKIYSLSANDFECLHQRAFYKKCIKDGYNNCALSKLLAHLMFDNFELSKKRIYMIMEAVNEGISLQDAKAACELIFNVSNINDRYAVTRLEWIFGIPQLQLKLTDIAFPGVTKSHNYEQQQDKNKENKFHSNSEKIFKFVSSILYGTSLESLIDRLLYKYQASSDFISILNYFFSIVFKNPITFIYFDALPHPKDEKLKLKDFIFHSANEELSRIYNITNSESKFEKAIKGITTFMDCYERKKQEFSAVLLAEAEGSTETSCPVPEKFKFQPAYVIGDLSKEIIHHREDDVINKHNLYCFEFDYENSIECSLDEEQKFNHDNKDTLQGLDTQRNLNQYIDDEGDVVADSNNNHKQDDVVISSVNNNKNENKNDDLNFANREEEKVSPPQKESSNKNNANNTNTATYSDEENSTQFNSETESKNKNKNYININNNSSNNKLINIKSSNSSDYSTGGHNYSNNYTGNKAIEDYTKNNEESFFKRNIEKLITNETPYVRLNPVLKQPPKATLHNQNCLRRIVLYNNSDNDYKVRFSFYTEDEFENFYLPKSDIIVIAKKNSVVNVQTFVKHDYLLPWNEFNYLIDCELYETGNNNTDNRFKDSNVSFKRSMSQADMKGDTANPAPLGILNF